MNDNPQQEEENFLNLSKRKMSNKKEIQLYKQL